MSQGTTYAFKISTRNIHGEGPLSDSVSITPAAPPDAPSGLNLISADSTHITFAWTAPYDGGKPINTYKVFWDAGQGTADPNAFIPTDPATAPVVANPQVTIQIGINPGLIYQFVIVAQNDIGDSVMSDVVSYIAAEVPGAPRSVSEVSADAT